MNNISHSNFIATLNNDATVRAAIQEMIAAFVNLSTMYGDPALVVANAIASNKDIAGVYVRNMLTSPYGNSPFGWSISKNLSNQIDDDIKNYPNVLLGKPLLRELDSTFTTLVTPSVHKRESKRRAEAKFSLSAPSIKLDMFSFNIYKNGIEAGKQLTGIDATRHIGLIPFRDATSEDQQIIGNKYLKVIWDHSKNKTIALVSLMNNVINSNAGTDIDKPYAVYKYGRSRKTTKWANQVTFAYRTIVSLAHKHSIPLQIHSHSITESQVYHYVTGVPKKGIMSFADVVFAFDKIKVLSFLDVEKDDDCPYFKIGINQLVSELQRDENKQEVLNVLSKHTPYLTQMAVNTDKIINTIKAHHE